MATANRFSQYRPGSFRTERIPYEELAAGPQFMRASHDLVDQTAFTNSQYNVDAYNAADSDLADSQYKRLTDNTEKLTNDLTKNGFNANMKTQLIGLMREKAALDKTIKAPLESRKQSILAEEERIREVHKAQPEVADAVIARMRKANQGGSRMNPATGKLEVPGTQKVFHSKVLTASEEFELAANADKLKASLLDNPDIKGLDGISAPQILNMGYNQILSYVENKGVTYERIKAQLDAVIGPGSELYNSYKTRLLNEGYGETTEQGIEKYKTQTLAQAKALGASKKEIAQTEKELAQIKTPGQLVERMALGKIEGFKASTAASHAFQDPSITRLTLEDKMRLHKDKALWDKSQEVASEMPYTVTTPAKLNNPLNTSLMTSDFMYDDSGNITDIDRSEVGEWLKAIPGNIIYQATTAYRNIFDKDEYRKEIKNNAEEIYNANPEEYSKYTDFKDAVSKSSKLQRMAKRQMEDNALEKSAFKQYEEVKQKVKQIKKDLNDPYVTEKQIVEGLLNYNNAIDISDKKAYDFINDKQKSLLEYANKRLLGLEGDNYQNAAGAMTTSFSFGDDNYMGYEEVMEKLGFDSGEADSYREFAELVAPTISGFVVSEGKYHVRLNNSDGAPVDLFVSPQNDALTEVTKQASYLSSFVKSGEVFGKPIQGLNPGEVLLPYNNYGFIFRNSDGNPEDTIVGYYIVEEETMKREGKWAAINESKGKNGFLSQDEVNKNALKAVRTIIPK
jgi:hypothetical protein